MQTVGTATTVQRGPLSFKKPTLDSVALRLHALYGDSPATWENRMAGEQSDYRQVARINLALLELGFTDKTAELMAPIDASLMGSSVPHLYDAIHLQQTADLAEDGSEETFVLALAKGQVAVSEAREWIKRSAAARFRAEQCEAAVKRWIEAQS